MKQLIAFLLVFVFLFSLAACTENETPSSDVSPTSTTTAQPTTTTTLPAKVNPKTDFVFGKYVATYFDNDNQSYHKVSLIFNQEYESLEYQLSNFYTKEYCKKRYQDMDMEFSEETFQYEYDITLNGVTYYDINDFEILPETYEITDTTIRVSPDFENWGVFSLRADGTMILDSADSDRYGKTGTVFTLAEE